MLANWSRQRFWDCVVSSQRDIFGLFLFHQGPKNFAFFKNILIFHTVRPFSLRQVVAFFSRVLSRLWGSPNVAIFLDEVSGSSRTRNFLPGAVCRWASISGRKDEWSPAQVILPLLIYIGVLWRQHGCSRAPGGRWRGLGRWLEAAGGRANGVLGAPAC